ncbi:MAG: universal stress protein [Candidatus Tectomicrobia bacterium]|nr:universal stress protein [Candidatus Tectomicrobia bacterium]
MYKRILVPLDGSELAEAILPQVEELAQALQGEIFLVRVVFVSIHSYPGLDLTQLQLSVINEAESYLEKVAQRLTQKGLKVDTSVRYGDTAEEILEHIHDRGIDLIAMSTHGRSGIKRWMLGSVAEKVLRAASVPLLLIRASQPDDI